jgi:uncharacterized protein
MPTVVHLDVAADNPERAKKFYEELFNWKFMNYPGMDEFFLFESTNLNGEKGVGGGLGKRGEPGQRMTAYFGVASVDEYLARITKLGGKVTLAKMAVPGMGYMANCQDTEGNPFGIWQEDKNAK